MSRLVRGVATNSGSEGGALTLRLVHLIATPGLATEDPHKESGTVLRDRARLQHMNGSRCQALPLWDRGRGARPPWGSWSPQTRPQRRCI